MQKLVRLGAALFLSSFITGCGALSPFEQDWSLAGFTHLKIASQRQPMDLSEEMLSLGGVHMMYTPMNGGVLVYAKQTDGPARMVLHYPSDTSTITFNIPNGTYHFYAIGYESANLLGATECGLGLDAGAQNVLLTGGSKTISAALTNGVGGGCDQTYFAPAAYRVSGGFYSLFVASCGTGDGLTETGGGNCAVSGSVGSISVSLTTTDPAGNVVPDGLNSACFVIATAGAPVTTNILLPAGNSTSEPMLTTVIHTFSDTACVTSSGDYILPNGYSNSTTSAIGRLSGVDSNATADLNVVASAGSTYIYMLPVP